MPRESQNSSGQIVLEYAKATQESVFEQLRVVRDGQLRIVFSPDLKVGYIQIILSLSLSCQTRTLYCIFLVRYSLGNSVLGGMKSLFHAGF